MEKIVEQGVKVVKCESNMGHGLFEINLRAIIAKHLKEAEEKGDRERVQALTGVGVIGEYSTGQKERRIIDSFVSAAQRHRIVVHRKVFESDRECGQQHSAEKRAGYSFFYQYANITTDRGSLPHDDRLEAAAGAVRHWKQVLVVDEDKAAEARKALEAKEFIDNPMGYEDQPKKARGIRRNIYKRR